MSVLANNRETSGAPTILGLRTYPGISINGGFLHKQHKPYRRLLYLRLTNQRSQRLTPIDGTAGRDDPKWVGAGELEYLAEAVGLQTRTLSRARGIDDLGVLVDLDAHRSGRFIHGRFGHGAKDGSTESPIPEERGHDVFHLQSSTAMRTSWPAAVRELARRAAATR